jgi:hypothetical protein
MDTFSTPFTSLYSRYAPPFSRWVNLKVCLLIINLIIMPKRSGIVYVGWTMI